MHFLDILFCIFRKLLQRVKSTSEDVQSYLPVLNTQREMYILFMIFQMKFVLFVILKLKFMSI